MTKVVFRADAGPGIGAGHIGRCLALASGMRARGWLVVFAVREGTRDGAPFLAEGEWPLVLLSGPAEAEAEAIAAACGGMVDLLIVDHYGRGAGFERACRRFARRIAVLDDIPGQRRHDADVLIDGAPGRTAAAWHGALDDGACVLAGADYALVRPEILAARERVLARNRTGTVSRVLVSFGLSDARNATEPALRAARAAFPGASIDVVIGPSAAHRGAVTIAAEEVGATLWLAPGNYVELLVAADLVVGAGGVSAIERACLGIPSVAIETADNQRAGLEALSEAGALVHAGSVDALDVRHLTRCLVEAAADRVGLASRATLVVDGRGAVRAVDVFEKCVRRTV